MYDFNIRDFCVICCSPFVERHHVFHGSHRRKFADKYGYIIPLCHAHHVGDHGIHFNHDLDEQWKQIAQRHYEAHYGTREDFIRECGKSYL